jgi:hypothetical protein
MSRDASTAETPLDALSRRLLAAVLDLRVGVADAGERAAIHRLRRVHVLAAGWERAADLRADGEYDAHDPAHRVWGALFARAWLELQARRLSVLGGAASPAMVARLRALGLPFEILGPAREHHGEPRHPVRLDPGGGDPRWFAYSQPSVRAEPRQASVPSPPARKPRPDSVSSPGPPESTPAPARRSAPSSP